jgi:hypothetical protein
VKRVILIVVAGFLALQVVLFGLVWGSPQMKLERSYTPTPSATPRQPEPTPIDPTPIPTLIPVGLGAPTAQVNQASAGDQPCLIAALDLIAAWVKADKPESAAFPFSAVDGKACQGTFSKDVQPLFNQPNIWFGGALACTACHSADVTQAAANMSLGSYAGIRAGSRRTDNATQDQDILGDAATWEKSKLYLMITTRQMPIGRPANSPERGPLVKAGK